MSDISQIMVERAWVAYEEYKSLKSSSNIDFDSFAVGFFLGAIASVRSTRKKETPQ